MARASRSGFQRDVRSDSSHLPTQHRRSQENRRKPLCCFHCGVPGHKRVDCRLRNVVVVCRRCGADGHKSRYCQSAESTVAHNPNVIASVARNHVAQSSIPSLFQVGQYGFFDPSFPNYHLNFPPLPNPPNQTF
jgi:hypothetical protein